MRNRRRVFLLRLAWGSTEIIRHFLTAAFLFSLIGMPSLPIRHVLLLFASAAILTALSAGRGLPVAGVLAVHLIGFAVAAGALLVEIAGRFLPPGAAGRLEGAATVLASPDLPYAPYAAALLAVTYGLFWFSGFSFARRAPGHGIVAGRIDAGIGIIFAIVFLSWGTRFPLPVPLFLLPGYFFFAFCALALAAAPPAAERHYLAGFRILGAGVTFLAALLAAGTAAAVWAYPLLSEAARTGYRIAADVLAPLGPFFERLLRLLLGFTLAAPRAAREAPPPPQISSIPVLEEPSWWELVLERVLAGTMIAAASAAMLLLAGWMIVRLIALLRRRTPSDGERIDLRALLTALTLRLLRLLRRLFHAAATVLPGRAGAWRAAAPDRHAQEAFARLCRWGRRSGFPRNTGETAREYGARLAAVLPSLQTHFDVLVDALHRELYACSPLTRSERHVLRESLRELHSPRHLRTRFSARISEIRTAT